MPNGFNLESLLQMCHRKTFTIANKLRSYANNQQMYQHYVHLNSINMQTATNITKQKPIINSLDTAVQVESCITRHSAEISVSHKYLSNIY